MLTTDLDAALACARESLELAGAIAAGLKEVAKGASPERLWRRCIR